MSTRRDFMGGAAALLLAPFFSRVALAGRSTCSSPAERQRQLRDLRRRAEETRKPLLVLAIPSDATEAYHRGAAFGEWLNHGGDTALALLAEVELACASAAELQLLTGNPAPEPALFWLFDGATTAHHVALQHAKFSKGGGDNVALDAAIDRRILALTKLLKAALAPGAASRAKRSVEGLSDAHKALLAGEAIATAPLMVVDRRAAWLNHERGEEVAVRQRLAAAARERVVTARVPGSHWVNGGGCGEHIEGIPEGEQEMVDCGMGFVPDRSARFLRFWTGFGCPG